MRMVIFVWIAAFVWASVPLALGAQSTSLDWIAFETIDQSALPIVRARMNGMEGHRFVLDAGFRDVILDTTIVAGTGMELVSHGEVATIDFYGREEKVPVAYVQQLELGEVEFQMVRALLVEGEDGTGIGGLRSYGRIGRDLLEPLRLTVHYPRRLLYLEPSPKGEVPSGSVAYESAGRFLLIPVQLAGDGAVEVVKFVLDAGTSNTVLDRRWAERRGLAEKGETVARIPLLSAGAFEAENVPALLGEMKDLPYEGRPVGVLGADLLTGLSVTYDFARDLIWLTPVDEEEPS